MSENYRYFKALTARVNASKEIQLDNDIEYVRWAELALEKNLDSPALRQLASLSQGENHFLVLSLVHKALDELGFPVLVGLNAAIASTQGILELALMGNIDPIEALHKVAEISIDFPQANDLRNFALLETSLRWIDEPNPSLIKLASYDEARRLFMEYANEFVNRMNGK